MIEVFVTYDPMEANLVKAKLTDEEIPFRVTGDYNIAISMESFNTVMGRIASEKSDQIFCSRKPFRAG